MTAAAEESAVGHKPCFIVGCGDIGRRVALLEQAAGHAVTALARSDAGAARLVAAGIAICRGDLDAPDSLRPMPTGVGVLYYFAPPPPTGTDDPRLAAWLASITAGSEPQRVVYISSSGVYGDCQGAWVDEGRPLNPTSDRARRRAAAEKRLQHWARRTGTAIVILRVPGIYGPGRLPVARLREGAPVVRETEAPCSNRIHADDLASACLAAGIRGKAGQAYNVSDGHPSSMTDYFLQVADALGLPRPREVGLAQARRVLSPAMLSFLAESKRLDNRKMLAELGVTLRYPTLEQGLRSCI